MDAEDQEERVIICPPLSLDPVHGAPTEKQGGLLSKLIELFQTVGYGSDITKFQVPVQLNMPKSQLQIYGESVYCCGEDLLSKCTEGSTPRERFLSVVAWHISTTRLAPFGQAPFNPILGETHHVSCGDLNVLLEQVSHHPPITALYATNSVKNIRLQWWQNARPHFYGNKVEVTVHGKRSLWLDSHDEEYETSCPKLLIRFLPIPGNEWIGSTTVKCSSSGLDATIIFKPKPFFGLTGALGEISGKIRDTNTNEVLYEVSGGWNKVVNVREMKTGEVTAIFDAQSALTNLRAPSVRDGNELWASESVMVWRKAMEGLVRREWDAARQAKSKVENRQRALAKERKEAGKGWIPKHFARRAGDGGTGEGGWEWEWEWGQPGRCVPAAPLVVTPPKSPPSPNPSFPGDN